MILHVDFSDGSNPWVCFSDNRREIAEHWREWMKYHGDTARPTAYNGNYICEASSDRAGFLVYKQGEFWDTAKHYKRLGFALSYLETKGGGQA